VIKLPTNSHSQIKWEEVIKRITTSINIEVRVRVRVRGVEMEIVKKCDSKM
jgi:hypothetical protein